MLMGCEILTINKQNKLNGSNGHGNLNLQQNLKLRYSGAYNVFNYDVDGVSHRCPLVKINIKL